MHMLPVLSVDITVKHHGTRLYKYRFILMQIHKKQNRTSAYAYDVSIRSLPLVACCLTEPILTS